MPDGTNVPDDVSAFLVGDGTTHEDLRRIVGAVVGSFHLGSATREELVQEALYRTFVSLKTGSFRGEASLKTYARKVAEYTCLEYVRRIQARSEIDADAIPELPGEPGPERVLLRAEEHRGNLRKLAAMPEPCRELFRLIFIEKLSYLEVAGRLGISETAVKLRVHRCRLATRKGAGA